MMTKKEYIYHKLYMDIAVRISEMSYSKRLKVGCICVQGDRIISMGWNGMPPGMDNCCEENNDGCTTKPEVLHSEENMIGKLAKHGESAQGSTIYLTHSPCINCAKILYVSGISRVLYKYDYRDNAGLKFLEQFKAIHIIKFEDIKE